jgi:hypothetical protein
MPLRTVKFRFDPGTKKVTADDIVRAMRTVLGATGDLASWQIKKMSLASPLVIEGVCTQEMYQPISTFARCMRDVETEKKKHVRLTGAAAKLLDSVDFVTRNYFGSVQIAPSAQLSVTMNRAAIQKARQATGQLEPSLMIHAREQIGQLRGYLEQITQKRGQPARFAIRDRITGEVVPCVIPEGEEHLLATAKKALGSRVVVSGVIRYGEQSQPTSIKAGSIDPIEEFIIPFDRLPRAPLTEDGDSVAQIRRLRDG